MSTQNGDIVKVTFEVSLHDGTIAQNVHYFKCEFAAAQSDAGVTSAIETWIETAYGELTPNLPSSMTQRVCTVQEIAWDAIDGQWEVTRLIGYFTPTISFTNASDELPNQSSAFATFNTSRPKSRGRTFVMPFGEDRQDGTYLISAALTDMTDFADELLDDIVLGPLNELIPGIPRQALEVFLPFTLGIVTDLLGSQRRRRPTVGI